MPLIAITSLMGSILEFRDNNGLNNRAFSRQSLSNLSADQGSNSN